MVYIQLKELAIVIRRGTVVDGSVVYMLITTDIGKGTTNDVDPCRAFEEGHEVDVLRLLGLIGRREKRRKTSWITCSALVRNKKAGRRGC